ncbi:MAG TPA: hypothetical protein VNK94_03395 [Gaiellaceae bacterium]|nr:hypothetical protein [Gaiellaceae bacterium]
MRGIKWAILASAIVVAAIPPTALGDTTTAIDATLMNTVVSGPGDIPGGRDSSPLGVGWHDAAGGWHARNVPVSDDIVDGSGAPIGTMNRSVSFNVHVATGASTAWCDFTMTLTGFGTFEGHCNGSLLEGHFSGHGSPGSTLSGTYALAPGGIPGVGPYLLDMVVRS